MLRARSRLVYFYLFTGHFQKNKRIQNGDIFTIMEIHLQKLNKLKRFIVGK